MPVNVESLDPRVVLLKHEHDTIPRYVHSDGTFEQSGKRSRPGSQKGLWGFRIRYRSSSQLQDFHLATTVAHSDHITLRMDHECRKIGFDKSPPALCLRKVEGRLSIKFYAAQLVGGARRVS